MITNDLDDYIQKYIEGYLFADLESVRDDIDKNKHPGNGAYLLLLSTLSAMEFLGLLLREGSPIGAHGGVDASLGLGSYIKNYLSLLDPRYKVLCEIAPRLIRNGIAHAYATKGNIAITRMGNRIESHLVMYGTRKILILNADCLLEDFLESYEQHVKPHLVPSDGSYENVKSNYEAIRGVYLGEVTAAIAASQRKFNQLEHLYTDIDGTLEELEFNGHFILVS